MAVLTRLLLVLALVGLPAGCGDDDENGEARTATAPERTATAEETETETEATTSPTETEAETQTEAETEGACNLDGLTLEPLNNSVACAEAQRVAVRYDLQGPKVQEVGNWTCATGTAATRPIVFSCTLGDKEFVAREGP